MSILILLGKKLLRVLKSKSSRHMGVYFITNFISKLLPLFLLPVITRYLIPEEYGRWSIFSAILVFVFPCVSLLLRHQINRNYFKVTKNELAVILWNVIVVNITLMIFMYAVFFLFSLFYKEFAYGNYLYVVPFIALLNALKEYYLTVVRYEGRPVLYGIVFLMHSALHYVLAILFIVQYHFSWEALVAGFVTALTLVGIFVTAYLIKKRYITCEFRIASIKESMKIGVPLIPHMIGEAVITMSDRFILGSLLSLEVVGIYAVGDALGSAIQIATYAFGMSWEPWVYKQLAELTEEKKKRMVKFTYMYVAMLPVLWLCVCIAGHIYLVYFVDERYHAALPIVYWVAGATAVRGLITGIFVYAVHIRKTIIYPIVTGIAACVKIVLSIYFIRVNGIVGSGQATLIAYVVMAILAFIYTQRYFPMPWMRFRKNT